MNRITTNLLKSEMTLKGFSLLYFMHYIMVKLERLKLKLHHRELDRKIQNNFELFPKSISFWIRMIRPFYHTINHFWPCWTIFDQAWKTDKQNEPDLSDRYIEWGQFKNQTKFRYFVFLFYSWPYEANLLFISICCLCEYLWFNISNI